MPSKPKTSTSPARRLSDLQPGHDQARQEKSDDKKSTVQKATGSPRTGTTVDDLKQSTNRESIASKLDCSPDDFLVYREFDRMDDPLCRVIVAITPDGRKFKFNANDLTPIS